MSGKSTHSLCKLFHCDENKRRVLKKRTSIQDRDWLCLLGVDRGNVFMLSRMKEQYKNTTWFDMDAMSKTQKEVPNEAHLTHLDLKVTWLGNDRVEG